MWKQWRKSFSGREETFPLLVFGTESRDRIVILFLSLLCVLSALGPGMKVLLDCALLPLTPLSHLVISLGHLVPEFAFQPEASASLWIKMLLPAWGLWFSCYLQRLWRSAYQHVDFVEESARTFLQRDEKQGRVDLCFWPQAHIPIHNWCDVKAKALFFQSPIIFILKITSFRFFFCAK